MKRLLLLTIFAALFLRLWGLDKVPPELFGDELDVGYHAYSLLTTSRDYYGQLLPTYIHSFSEWRAPGLMYATVPFVAIFGLNEWGIRLPSAVFSVITLILLYFLTQKITGNNKIAFWSVLILTVSPWHIQYSRAAFEVSLLLMLLSLGVLFFVLGLKKNIYLAVSGVMFALTFYTYSTANLFTPLLLLLLFLTFKDRLKEIPKPALVFPSVLFILLSLPIGYQVLFGFAAERYNNFSIFTDSEIVRNINTKRAEGGDFFLTHVFHNKPLEWSRRILANYTSAFSPQFLFIDGDVTFRHSIHEMGQLYWVQLPLILLGIWSLLKRRSLASMFFLGWLLIAPISSSLTRDGAYHATRLILMLIPLTVISAYGLNELLELRKPKTKLIVLSIIFIFLVGQFIFYIYRYWVDYPKESWRWWHYGYKEAMQFMKEKETEYDIIAFNNTYEPALVRFLFWWQYPPDRFLGEFKSDKPQEGVLPGFNGFTLSNRYYFGVPQAADGGLANFVKPNILYLVSQRDEVAGDWDLEKAPPAGIKVLKTIRNPYNTPVFYVVTGVK